MGLESSFRFFTFLIFTIFSCFSAFSQSTKTAKAAPNAITSAGNYATVGTTTYSYSIGEPVIFTGAYASGFSTQGFQQPMICKTFPVIVASNQQSCALPYTLSVSAGFNKYQWKTSNSIIASGKDFTYFPIKNGNYSVFVGDSTGCFLNTTPVSVDLSAKNITPSIANYGTNISTDTLLVSSLAASYQWYVILGDGSHRSIVGAIDQSYRPLFKATYYVKINTVDNCVAYSIPFTLSNNNLEQLNKYNFEMTDSSINIKLLRKVYDRKLSVYPIPSKDNFNVDYESPESNTVFLNVYNVLGVVVASRAIKNETGKFKYRYDRNDLPAGKYILDVVDGDQKMIHSLILE
jgi:hypothetical protein